MTHMDRRTLLRHFASAGAGIMLSKPLELLAAPGAAVTTRKIPGTGQSLAVIGLGTWQTFNVGSDPVLRDQRTEVVSAFFELGGQMIDSSPMYGSSQDFMGYALDKLGHPEQLFSAEKVWTSDGDDTREEVATSADKWNLKRFDLMQVHNLLSWEPHLETLQTMKDNGEIKHVGISTSHGRRHRELEQIMTSHDIDFVQLTYNVLDREVEDRLLPLAQEKGIAVIANRPFGGGSLVSSVQNANEPLPAWARDIDCENWPQVLLKFIVSHPAVTCAIPATTSVEHVRENMGAAQGEMPDEATRQKIVDAVRAL
ncbi:aldo/keto reductase [Allohahella marinimesophila]|uniref:Aldo/keto reductase n=1 Tax=Allohahella marinimesophila TaxID=1054972 RepID=A0ABP7PFY0_9GAMM